MWNFNFLLSFSRRSEEFAPWCYPQIRHRLPKRAAKKAPAKIHLVAILSNHPVHSNLMLMFIKLKKRREKNKNPKKKKNTKKEEHPIIRATKNLIWMRKENYKKYKLKIKLLFKEIHTKTSHFIVISFCCLKKTLISKNQNKNKLFS